MNDNSTDPVATEPTAPTVEPKNSSGRRKIGLVLLMLVLSATLGGGWMWYQSKVELVTDDAFIAGHVHLISARVSGYVSSVAVVDNAKVASGDLLVVIDDAPYRAQMERSTAALNIAHNDVAADRAAVSAAQSAVSQAQTQARQAETDLARAQQLFSQEVIPQESLDQLRTLATVAQQNVARNRQHLRQAEAQLGGTRGNAGSAQNARVAERSAQLESARLNLSYTRITAPIAGYVTQKSVEVGTNVQAGQALLALVQLDEPWIIANYKESQLTHLEVGQRVEFVVDSYPDRVFRGKVDSIMAGTGAVFSLLPPENASGNYVKVVQRVPVKIAIDPASDVDQVLRLGMSVVPTIYTGRSIKDILAPLNPFN